MLLTTKNVKNIVLEASLKNQDEASGEESRREEMKQLLERGLSLLLPSAMFC